MKRCTQSFSFNAAFPKDILLLVRSHFMPENMSCSANPSVRGVFKNDHHHVDPKIMTMLHNSMRKDFDELSSIRLHRTSEGGFC